MRTVLPALLITTTIAACSGAPVAAPTPERVIGDATTGARLGLAGPHSPQAGVLSGRCLAPTSLLAKAAASLLDSGMGIVANHGGSIVSNNGGLAAPGVAGAGYATLAVGQRPLIGFKVRIIDAAGQPVRDAAGLPYEATTDRGGRYAFAKSPRGKQHLVELVLPDDLGRLVALLPDAPVGNPRQTELEGVGTHVLGYVLDQYVQGDQARLERLEANGEALAVDAAEAALTSAAAGVIMADSLATSALVSTVGVWRELSPAFSAQLDAIAAKVQAP